MGFEPTRAEPIGLAVQRLNHSATSSLSPFHMTKRWQTLGMLESLMSSHDRDHQSKNEIKAKKDYFPCQELNPDLLGESQL